MFHWLTGSPSRPPLLLKTRSSKAFIVITVSSSIFTDVFIYGIVVPVLPFALTSRAAIDPSRIQTWISIFLAVYGAAVLTAAPICGWWADRSSSRRTPLLLGLLALAGSTVMLCVGNSIVIFATGRVLQGISAAVVWVVGLALLVDTVGPDEVGQAMGYVGLSMSLALLVAPLLGGVVFELAGYYAVFAMAFGLMLLDIFLRVVLVEKKVAAQWIVPEQSNARNAALKIERGRDAVTDVETEANKTDEPDTRGTWNQAERTSVEYGPSPMVARRKVARLPPVIYLLGFRRLLSALFACAIQAALLTAFDTILPLYVRDTFNWTALGAGLIFLPLVIVSFFGPLVGYLTDKHGPRWYATAGYAFACPSLILLRLVHANTLEQKVLLCALLALVGLCLTLVITPIMAEITYAVDAKAERRPPGFFGRHGVYAQAYSLFNIAWAAGCMIGPLLGGLINQAYGWDTATLILGLISGFTAAPTAIWTGGSIFKRRRKTREQGVTTPSPPDCQPERLC